MTLCTFHQQPLSICLSVCLCVVGGERRVGCRRCGRGRTGEGISENSLWDYYVIIIIIIITFKGTIRDFLQSPHSAANRLRHVRSSGPGAIVCKSRATHTAFITCKCHVTCHLVRRDSSAIKFDRVEIALI